MKHEVMDSDGSVAVASEKNMLDHDEGSRLNGSLRFLIYALILLTATGSMIGRLRYTQKMVGDVASPLLSANDKSRWATVRSLNEVGGYEIESYTADPNYSRYWNTIDKVVHQGRGDRLHEYSSKPPLLATLFAGAYWALNRFTGLNFEENWFSVTQILLLLGQILPLVLTFTALAWQLDKIRWRERTISDWGKFFVFACACWGTFVTTFAVTLNNHHFAVIGVYWTLIALMQIRLHGQPSHFWFVVAGLSSAFAAANELPALAWVALTFLLCLVLDFKKCLRASVPAMLIIGFASFGTLLIAHQSLRPPYAHRSDGPSVVEFPEDFADDWAEGFMPTQTRRTLNRHSDKFGFQLSPSTLIEKNRFPMSSSIQQRWVIRDYYRMPWTPNQWRALALTQEKGQDNWQLRTWDNWYDYPGSYWHIGVRGGVDIGEPSPLSYAFHCLIGHHGILTLTPIWALSLLGIVLCFSEKRDWMWFAVLVTIISGVVIGFYLLRPQGDRNYGGQTSALRWLFWLSPMWIVVMIPAAEWLFRWNSGKWLAIILLIFSAASALYSGTNPWVHPWIYQWTLP